MCAKTTILLWLAAMAVCHGEDIVNIGDKKYTTTTLLKDYAFRHIVVNNGHVVYRKANGIINVLKQDTLESIEVHGLGDILVQDLAMDGTGAVWVATENGLYKMESVNSNVTYVAGKEKDLWCVAVDNNNTVYVAQFVSENVYVVRDNSLHKVPGISANSIAFSNNGDVYYSRVGASNVSKRKGIQATEVTEITMPEPHTPWTVELDKKTDTLYILSFSDHLFYVAPGGTTAFQVDELKDKQAIGTDDQGNIYLGKNSNIYKLTPIPTETVKVK